MSTPSWPALRVEDWTETRDTLQLWTQIVGKIRLAQAPMVNHWWQVTLYVTPRGLTTSAMPAGDGGTFEIEFDFCAHRLRITREGGEHREIALEPKTVAAFYAQVLEALDALGLSISIWPVPVEVERAIPFAQDTEHASYDPAAAQLFWRQLVQADRVMGAFRAGFAGKVSPVHFFWGAMDLAVTRFSGRLAPRHPGGAPNCGDWVMVEGYSHELASCGFWPGGGEEGAFYAYAYPEPEGYAAAAVTPAEAFYSAENGQFLLPYEAVRTAADPDATLLGFLQTTYDAAADLGGWDRAALDYRPVAGARP
jgi:hypothetical protein